MSIKNADINGRSALPAFKKPQQSGPAEAQSDPAEDAYGERLDLCAIAPPGWLCTRKPGHDGPCAAVKLDGPIGGPKMIWNADGLHIEDPLADKRMKAGSLPGYWTVDWETIDRMRARFAPKES